VDVDKYCNEGDGDGDGDGDDRCISNYAMVLQISYVARLQEITSETGKERKSWGFERIDTQNRIRPSLSTLFFRDSCAVKSTDKASCLAYYSAPVAVLRSGLQAARKRFGNQHGRQGLARKSLGPENATSNAL
jgi:hypothetical protein